MVSSSQILGARPIAIRRYGHALLLASLAALSACGQKGPLFIAVPPQPPGTSAAPAPVLTVPSVPPAPPLRPASASR